MAIMRAVYSLSTSAGRSNGVRAERPTDGRTQTERGGVTEGETAALFFNLARPDKTTAFRVLLGASAPVHHLDSRVPCRSLTAKNTHIRARLPACATFCPSTAESPRLLTLRHRDGQSEGELGRTQ